MTKNEALRLGLEALEDLGMKHHENTGEVLYKETFTAIKAALEAKDEPVAWMYEVNHAHTCLDLFEPPDDAYYEGTLYPLYTHPPKQEEKDEPKAWQVHPFDYGIGHQGVYARTDRPEQVEAWKRKGWNVQALYITPPQLEAKDEPLAWKNVAIRLGEELSSVGPAGYYDMTPEHWLDWAMAQQPQGKNSLPAPQRTWVGLMDEEICAEAMKKDQQSIGFIKGAEWAEAKLKGKNT